MATALPTLRVAVLGHGAIGSKVAEELASGRVTGAELVGVIGRSGSGSVVGSSRTQRHDHRRLTLDAALEAADLVVECAGGEAVREHGPAIVAAGRTLLVVSVGALAEPGLRHELLECGPGTCLLSTGAIGGLDILRAANRGSGLSTASLTSTKRAATLVQPWMSADQAEQLRTTTTPYALFEGGIEEAIRLFPASLNVGVALAAATGLWDETRISLIADPEAELTTHEISAAGRSGSYAFTITNQPLPDNPASSGVVSAALLRGIADLARPSGAFA
ncbi:aspartate dehydrogenase domain-containing protein [Leucobacter sp. GX24907]